MADNAAQRPNAERIVSHWENVRAAKNSIPPEAQDELRGLLSSNNAQIQKRVIAILNPRNADVVELSDEKLFNDYDITTRDNYAIPLSVDHADRTACFDARHGYYVALRIEPMDDLH